jgi:lysophospholipase L1-like esterase
MTRTVLCFGDSNTHGTPGDDPDYVRLAPGVRWPGQLRTRLGDGWTVVEEGLNGRTVASDYPDRPGLNGRAYLVPCLLSHNPLDAVVLMLGSNDVKMQFGLSVERLAGQWENLLDDLYANAFTADWTAPHVILVSPVPLDPSRTRYAEQLDSFDAASVAKSRLLAAAYNGIAKRRGLGFLDAATAAEVGDDGLHLTAHGHAALAEALAPVILSGANGAGTARP